MKNNIFISLVLTLSTISMCFFISSLIPSITKKTPFQADYTLTVRSMAEPSDDLVISANEQFSKLLGNNPTTICFIARDSLGIGVYSSDDKLFLNPLSGGMDFSPKSPKLTLVKKDSFMTMCISEDNSIHILNNQFNVAGYYEDSIFGTLTRYEFIYPLSKRISNDGTYYISSDKSTANSIKSVFSQLGCSVSLKKAYIPILKRIYLSITGETLGISMLLGVIGILLHQMLNIKLFLIRKKKELCIKRMLGGTKKRLLLEVILAIEKNMLVGAILGCLCFYPFSVATHCNCYTKTCLGVSAFQILFTGLVTIMFTFSSKIQPTKEEIH